MRRLLEQEELELGRGLDARSPFVGALEHAAQHAARADLLGLAGELAEEEQHVAFERQARQVSGSDAHGASG